MKQVVIRNPDEFVAASKRAAELNGAAAGSEEARELASLTAAMKVYEDAICMMRGTGHRAAEEAEEGVASLSGEE